MVPRNEMNDFGWLLVRVSAARGALPVDGALVIVRDTAGTEYARMYTDAGGETALLQLPTPALANSLSPEQADAYPVYELEISHPAYQTLQALPVQIFTGITSVLPIDLLPKSWPEVI